MTREEQIDEAVNTYMNDLFEDGIEIPIEDFENIEAGFIIGAEWADANPKSPWISVNEDLPCNHEEFIETGGHYLKETIEFITIDEYDVIVSNLMVLYDNGTWEWKYGARPRYWMQIPELPKRIGD